MSSPLSQYSLVDPQDSAANISDSDSDLNVDLDELDPIGAPPFVSNLEPAQVPANPVASIIRQTFQPSSRESSDIALRKLRVGGLRRLAASKNMSYSDRERDGNRDGNAEHSQALLNAQDGSDNRTSHVDGLGRFGDQAPLLDRSRAAAVSGYFRAFPRFGSALRRHFILRADKQNYGEVAGRAEDDASATRIVRVGSAQQTKYPANAVSNAKYTPFTFLPITLYNEFSFFFNMYFLLVAFSQAIPALRIGYLLTYIGPLVFVLAITMGKEAYDDIERRRRDNEANAEEYTVLHFDDVLPDSHPGSRAQKTLKSDSIRNAGKRRRPLADRLSDIQEEDRPEAASSNDLPSSRAFEVRKKSRDLRVGDVLKLGKCHRVPADVVILKCLMSEDGRMDREPNQSISDLLIDPESEVSSTQNKGKSSDAIDADDGTESVGEMFIRTDQLDGETDWKLRVASPLTQKLPIDEFVRVRVTGGKPDRRVNEFLGTVELLSSKEGPRSDSLAGNRSSPPVPLSIDNTAWANTVVASQGVTFAVVMYSGTQTRSALSTSSSRSKAGLLEYEINSLTKILCALTLALSIVLVALEGFEKTAGKVVWYVKVMRFLILFSTIVPINLRVNLDLGKSAYSWFIQHDPGIPGALVRTSTIPEDLGRIEYLLSDKTGTLTQNEMEMKKIHIGTVSYANEAMDEVAAYVRQSFNLPPSMEPRSQNALFTPSLSLSTSIGIGGGTRTRREIGTRVRDVVLALALCHNVTPTNEEVDGKPMTSYQASSPDEIAIIRWTESVGLRLIHRDRKGMVLASTTTGQTVVQVRILEVFPFTSDNKRMGIVVQFHDRSRAPAPDIAAGEIWFYQKGADTVMGSIVAANDWLDEETANMAREGLRTLVVGRRRLSPQQYLDFTAEYREASLAMAVRDAGMQAVLSRHLEHDLELLGVTGVEDRLQKDVKPSLELLRNAGIKIWMLTGDKVETARCVAISSKLVARGQYIHTVARLSSQDKARDHLDFLRNKPDSCLLIDGESLALFLTSHLRLDFAAAAVALPTVVACRCSPTQKAEVARLIKEFTRKRVCCIGDGGNDVSMIQAADVGVGIVGKEGRQASLAADFSIEQFHHLTKLLVWHGRNSYKRSAKLAQFVIHRGLIIAICQAVYSVAIKFEPEGLYKDWLMVGYATVYTALPVLSLVLDKDVDENLANLYPELYKELTSGRSLSYRTFFVWVSVSIYQGTVIQGLAQILTEVDGKRMVAVSYTVLVLNELLMVAVEITTWHPVMVLSIVGTFLLYFGSLPFLGDYFDLAYLVTWGFVWRVLAIAAISLVPPYAIKIIRRTVKPPSYRKVQSV